MKRLLCVIVYGILIINLSFAQKAGQDVKKESVDAKSFQTKLKETPDAVLLDVRRPEEVAQGKIKGATNIDFEGSDFQKKISTLDKSKTYFVYCAKGGRSSNAVDLMSSLGFKKLVNLDGGFIAWKDKGLPVEQK